MRLSPAPSRRSGLSLVELVLALGLFALLSVVLVQVIDSTLAIWEQAESERERMEIESAATEWLLRDLDYITGGDGGDFLVDWGMFDVDGDGIATRPLPRLRLVRRASAEDLLRLGLRTPVDDSGEVGVRPRGATPLVEVLWCVLPIGVPEGAPADGALELLRAEQLVGDDEALSFFDRRFFGSDGFPRGGDLERIASGVLHLRFLFAAQTTLLDKGWKVGTDLRDAVVAWDAKNLGRPDPERTVFNRTHRSMPQYDGDPLLPRRIRIELEFERPDDARRRTTLADVVAGDADRVTVLDPGRLPERGGLILIGEEWMRVRGFDGATVTVERAQRGTRAVDHKLGAPVRFAETTVRELIVPLHREDWSL